MRKRKIRKGKEKKLKPERQTEGCCCQFTCTHTQTHTHMHTHTHTHTQSRQEVDRCIFSEAHRSTGRHECCSHSSAWRRPPSCGRSFGLHQADGNSTGTVCHTHTHTPQYHEPLYVMYTCSFRFVSRMWTTTHLESECLLAAGVQFLSKCISVM